MNIKIKNLLVVIFFSCSISLLAVDENRTLNDAVFDFENTFGKYEEQYDNVKKYFISQGKDVLPFIRKQLASKNVSHRLLAKIIIAEIMMPSYINGNRHRFMRSIYSREIINSENSCSYHHGRKLYYEDENKKYFTLYYDKLMHYEMSKLNEVYFKASEVLNVTPEVIADLYWSNKNDSLFPAGLKLAKYPDIELFKFLSCHLPAMPSCYQRFFILYNKGVLSLGKSALPEARKFIKKITKERDRIISTGDFEYQENFKWNPPRDFTYFMNITLFTELLLKEKDPNDYKDVIKLADLMLILELADCETDTCVEFFGVLSNAKIKEALPAIAALYIHNLKDEKWQISRDKNKVYGRKRRNRKSQFFAYEYFLKRYGEEAAEFLASDNFKLPECVKKEFKYYKIDEYQINALRYALAGDIRNKKTRRWKVAKARKKVLLNNELNLLWKLHCLTGESIYPRVLPFLGFKRGRYYSRRRNDKFKRNLTALSILKKLKTGIAVPILKRKIFHDYEDIMQALAGSCPWEDDLRLNGAKNEFVIHRNKKKKVKLDPKINLQLIREKGNVFGSMYENVFRQLIDGDAIIRVLRDIRAASSKKVLKQIHDYQPFRKQAEVALAYLNKDIRKLETFAKSKDNAYRDEASLVLTEKHIKDYSRSVFKAAARRNAYDIFQWKNYVRNYCWDINTVLHFFVNSENHRERVLAKVMLMELDNPAKVALYRKNFKKAADSVHAMQALSVDDIFKAGEGLVKSKKNKSNPVFDESFLPLLEYTAIFEKGIVRRGIAVASISAFKKNRSLPVLKDALEMGSICGDNPAVWALKKFGLPANEMSVLIPPPVPGEKDVGLKMTSFRGGTQLLAAKKDIRGIDNIVKGLETLLADYKISMWEYRADIFLKAATHYKGSAKLNKILLKILKNNDDQVWVLHDKAISLLVNSGVPELPQLLFKELILIDLKAKKFKNHDKYQYCLNGYRYQDHIKTVLQALLLIYREKLPDVMLKKYQEKKGDMIYKKQLLLAMTSLSYYNGGYIGDLATLSMQYIIDKEAAKKVALNLREKVFPLLLESLQSKNKELSKYTAKMLYSWSFNTGSNDTIIRSDRRGALPLFKWCRKNRVLFYNVDKFFKAHIPMNELCVFLCSMYVERKLRDAELLDKAGYTPFFTAVCKYLDAYYKKNPDREVPSDIHYLHPSDKTGRKFLIRILLENLYNQDYRVEAAQRLGNGSYKPAAKPVYRLLTKILKEGPDSKNIIASYRSKQSVFQCNIKILFDVLYKLDPALAKKAAKFAILHADKSIRHHALEILIADKTSS